MKTIILSLIACLCAPCLLPTAPAAEFYPIVNVTSSTQDTDFFQVINLIEGPGVGFSDTEPYERMGSTWVTAACGFPCDYLEGAEPPVIVLDLGADVNLSEISVWGYADTNANGAKEITVRFATEAEGETGFGLSITYNPMFPVVIDQSPRQSSLFDRTVHARYVEITCTDNYFVEPGDGTTPGSQPGGDRVGLGEVAFEIIAADSQPNIVAPISVTIPPTSQVTDAAVSLRNTGVLPLTITGASLSGPNAAAFAILSRPTTLAMFQSGDVQIRFTPGALTGNVSATLTVTSNDPDAPTIDTSILASVPPPNLVAPASLTIPPTFDVTDASITLQNTGVLVLNITAATLSGPNAAAFSVLSQPSTIAALSSEDLQIRFTPDGLTGVVSATLTIASNDADSPSVDIALIASIPPPTSQFFPIVDATSSSDPDYWPVTNLIQGPGVGFGEESPHDQLGGGGTDRWVTTACGYPCDYLAGAPPPVIILDLGQTRTLEEIDVWGYTASNANGVKEFQLRFATEAEGTENFGASITYNPTFTIDENNDVRRFQYAFDKPIVARYVEFTCTDNFFVEPGDGSTPGSQPGGDRVGLGEIAFPTTSTVVPVAPLAITAVQRNAATRAFTLTFTSEAGKTYTIKRSTDLASWTDIASDVPATAATTDFTDSDIAAGDAQFYYRVTRP